MWLPRKGQISDGKMPQQNKFLFPEESLKAQRVQLGIVHENGRLD